MERVTWFDISPLGWTGVLAVVAAGVILGLERQISGKPVGIRTSILICLGTYVFVTLGRQIPAGPSYDPGRILSMVITGVGFIGAGVMFSRDGSVVGVTSAATIWVLAAIGATIGLGYATAGVKIALVSVLVLVGVNQAETQVKLLQRGVHRRLQQHRQPKAPDPPKDRQQP